MGSAAPPRSRIHVACQVPQLYLARSDGVAFRAEMMRITSPPSRYECTTTRTRNDSLRPRRTNRSSIALEWSVSEIKSPFSSSKADRASTKVTPCFRRLTDSLSTSQTNRKPDISVPTLYVRVNHDAVMVVGWSSRPRHCAESQGCVAPSVPLEIRPLAQDLHIHGRAGDPVNGIMTLPWLCFAARGIALRALWTVEQDPRRFWGICAGTPTPITRISRMGRIGPGTYFKLRCSLDP